MSRILVTGASGQLGAAIVQQFQAHEVIGHRSTTLDISNADAVRRAVDAAKPDVIINCAAFNDVDGAESRPMEALAINTFAVRTLARAADAVGAVFVHYSSDFVFDGKASEPYTEESRPAPLSTYASSKLLGEWLALDASRGFALRVESLFGSPRDWSGRRGTLDAMVQGLEAGREVRVFTDRIVSPGYVVDIAAATRHLIETGAAPGLYHCVNAGHASWEEVARELARLLGVAPRLVPMTMEQVQFKAARPRYCALSIDKLTRAGYAMPAWQDALRRWLENH